MKLQSLKEISRHMGCSTNNQNMVSGAAVDSRLVRPGDLFFALPGAQVDGHEFIEAAASAGASGAVVRQNYHGGNFGLPLLYVPDTLLALQDTSKAILKSGKASVVAVTGSLGKTTTKGFIASLLKHKFKVSASLGNSNSQIGLPLAILNHTSENDELIILEMGMTLPGQLSRLIDIAPPEVAVITTVALVHAENFDSLSEIAKAKSEIFSNSATKLGIYHTESDINNFLSKAGSCRKQSFSMADVHSDFSLEVNGKGLKIKDVENKIIHLPFLEVPGVHNCHNFLAAVAVARNFGMDWEEIKIAQSTLELPERRLQIIEKLGAVFVNDAYNASEKSMIAALNSLPQPKLGGKKIAFLGGMVELGKFSEGCHRTVGKYALDHVDHMFCFGEDCLPIVEEWKCAGRPVVWAKERLELLSALRQHLQAGDVVLLKGSRAKGVWKVLDELH